MDETTKELKKILDMVREGNIKIQPSHLKKLVIFYRNSDRLTNVTEFKVRALERLIALWDGNSNRNDESAANKWSTLVNSKVKQFIYETDSQVKHIHEKLLIVLGADELVEEMPFNRISEKLITNVLNPLMEKTVELVFGENVAKDKLVAAGAVRLHLAAIFPAIRVDLKLFGSDKVCISKLKAVHLKFFHLLSLQEKIIPYDIKLNQDIVDWPEISVHEMESSFCIMLPDLLQRQNNYELIAAHYFSRTIESPNHDQLPIISLSQNPVRLYGSYQQFKTVKSSWRLDTIEAVINCRQIVLDDILPVRSVLELLDRMSDISTYLHQHPNVEHQQLCPILKSTHLMMQYVSFTSAFYYPFEGMHTAVYKTFLLKQVSLHAVNDNDEFLPKTLRSFLTKIFMNLMSILEEENYSGTDSVKSDALRSYINGRHKEYVDKVKIIDLHSLGQTWQLMYVWSQMQLMNYTPAMKMLMPLTKQETSSVSRHHHSMALSMSAIMYISLQLCDEAVRVSEQVLEIVCAVHKHSIHPQIASVQFICGMTHLLRHDYEAAGRLLSESVKTRMSLFSDEKYDLQLWCTYAGLGAAVQIKEHAHISHQYDLLKRAEQIRSYQDSHSLIACQRMDIFSTIVAVKLYKRLGQLYFTKQKYGKALEYAQSGIKVYSSLSIGLGETLDEIDKSEKNLLRMCRRGVNLMNKAELKEQEVQARLHVIYALTPPKDTDTLLELFKQCLDGLQQSQDDANDARKITEKLNRKLRKRDLVEEYADGEKVLSDVLKRVKERYEKDKDYIKQQTNRIFALRSQLAVCWNHFIAKRKDVPAWQELSADHSLFRDMKKSLKGHREVQP